MALLAEVQGLGRKLLDILLVFARSRGFTRIEASAAAPEAAVPLEARAERGFNALVVAGPLDFARTGVLASLAAPLAQPDVSLFALSTFDTADI